MKDKKINSNSVSELIHTDLCGLIENNIRGYKDSLSIINDYSRFLTITVICFKSSAAELVKQYLVKAER